MTSETSRPSTPGSIGKGNIVLQRDFHGRLMLCDHVQNTMVTAEDWITHERIRIGQDIQPRHCEDYEVLTQIIDDVFHYQQQSYDNWIENIDPPRIRAARVAAAVAAAASASTSNKQADDNVNDVKEKKEPTVDVPPLKKIDSSKHISGQLSGLNTPNLSPTTTDPLMNTQRNRTDSPDHSLPQTPSPVLSPQPTTPKETTVPQWKSPMHRLYAHCSESASCINVSLELESLQKLCDSWESTTGNLQVFKAILSNHVAALIQSIALDATDHEEFETMMDIRAEMILFLEHNYHWSTMSGRFAGYFNFASFVQLVTDAQQSIQLSPVADADSNKVEPQHKIKRPGKRRSLREEHDGSSDDFDESGEESAKRKRQQSITALQEKLHKMKVEIEQGGLVRLNITEDHS